MRSRLIGMRMKVDPGSLGELISCARRTELSISSFVRGCEQFFVAQEKTDVRLAQDNAAGEAFRETIQGRLQGVLQGFSTSHATAVGNSARALSQFATAVGDASKATAEYSTALGSSAHAGGDRSTALGSSARATGRQRYRHRFGGYCGGERGGYRFDRPRLQIAGSRGLTDGEP